MSKVAKPAKVIESKGEEGDIIGVEIGNKERGINLGRASNKLLADCFSQKNCCELQNRKTSSRAIERLGRCRCALASNRPKWNPFCDSTADRSHTKNTRATTTTTTRTTTPRSSSFFVSLLLAKTILHTKTARYVSSSNRLRRHVCSSHPMAMTMIAKERKRQKSTSLG